MKIGFIGLGIMGKPMSTNLIKAGHDLMVHTPKEHVMDEVVALGAKKGTLAETAAFGDVLITMVPDSPQVRQVALGQDGILENARPGTTLIDMSSIDPNETRAIGAALLEKARSRSAFHWCISARRPAAEWSGWWKKRPGRGRRPVLIG